LDICKELPEFYIVRFYQLIFRKKGMGTKCFYCPLEELPMMCKLQLYFPFLSLVQARRATTPF